MSLSKLAMKFGEVPVILNLCKRIRRTPPGEEIFIAEEDERIERGNLKSQCQREERKGRYGIRKT